MLEKPCEHTDFKKWKQKSSLQFIGFYKLEFFFYVLNPKLSSYKFLE